VHSKYRPRCFWHESQREGLIRTRTRKSWTDCRSSNRPSAFTVSERLFASSSRATCVNVTRSHGASFGIVSRRSPMRASSRSLWSMAKAKPRSWWRMRQIRHRDAVALAVLSSSFLLAGELVNQDIPSVYEKYIVQSGALNNFGFLLLIVALIILGFTTYFGGV